MIGRLSGIIAARRPEGVLLDVNGIGFLVQASPRALEAWPATGQAAVIYIETVIGQDSFRLYGFADDAGCRMFRRLLNVQGIGPKAASSLVGELGVDGLLHALSNADKVRLAKVPGIGPKAALRLITELSEGKAAVMPTTISPGNAGPSHDAVSAMVNLGYTPLEAGQAVARALQALPDTADVGSVIRAALRECAVS